MSRAQILRALTGLFLLLACLSPLQRELFVGDETKYGQVVREMTTARTIAVPHLEGEPYTHKPPLHFWIVRALAALFGPRSIWPFVLPSLVATLALVWLTGRVARELAGDDAAVWAELVVSSFALVWGVGQSARMDSEFVLLTTAASFYLWRYFERSSRSALVASAGCAAIATLVKGPFAPMILLAHYAFESARRRRHPASRDLLALPVLLVAPLLWLVPATVVAGRGWIEEIVMRQGAGRLVNAWTHAEPPWFYLTAAPAIWFPWVLLLAGALIAGWREERPALRFCVLQVAATLVPFSLVSSKLPVYMLPTMPAAAVLVGAFVVRPDERLARFARIGNRAVLALLALAGAAGVLAGPGLTDKPEEAALLARWEVQALFVALALGGVVAIVWDVRGRMEPTARNAIAIAIALLVPLSVVVTICMPVANEEASTARLVRELSGLDVAGSEIATYYTPHLWTRDMPESLEQVRRGGRDLLAASPPPRIVVVRADRAPDLGAGLLRYARRGSVVMIGKRFDVYEIR